jgi:hypothetical protein
MQTSIACSNNLISLFSLRKTRVISNNHTVDLRVFRYPSIFFVSGDCIMMKTVFLMIIHATTFFLVGREFIAGQTNDSISEILRTRNPYRNQSTNWDGCTSVAPYYEIEPNKDVSDQEHIKMFKPVPRGDYSYLRLVIATDQELYSYGRPVLLTIILENDVSNPSEFVAVTPSMSSSLFEFNQIKLTDSNGIDVPLTFAGQRMKQRAGLLKIGEIIEKSQGKNEETGEDVVSYPIRSTNKLRPGAKLNIIDGMRQWKEPAPNSFFSTLSNEFNLNLYYDLTLPGKYHLKIYRFSVCAGPEYEIPLCSNTVTFVISDKIPMSRRAILSWEGNATTECDKTVGDLNDFIKMRELASKMREQAIEENRVIRESGQWHPPDKEEQLKFQRLTASERIDTSVKCDYTQLRYTIRMNRPGKYKLGEPIFICGYVKNMSDSQMNIPFAIPKSLFSVDKVILVDTKGNDVPMTRTGILDFENSTLRPGWIRKKDGEFERSFFPLIGGLPPQAEQKLLPNQIVLNHYFDLTRLGVYCLTFHRIHFQISEKYDEPLVSNTLTFEVFEEFVTPEDLKDLGEFNWPPPEKPDETQTAQPPDAVKPVVE